MRVPTLLLLSAARPGLAQPPSNPALPAQKEAMKRLAYMAGKWTGEAAVGPQGQMKIAQTEQIEFRLDGTILLIEGTGRDSSGKVVFNAVGIISYDETRQAYSIRAYSDGRKIDSDFEVSDKGFAWGFASGPASVRHQMTLSESGEWVETTKIKMGDRPEFQSVRMQLKKIQ